MKRSFTLVAMLLLAFATVTQAQSALRAIEIDGKLHVQAKLGVDIDATPGPGADFCNLDTQVDTLLFDVTFSLAWDPAEVDDVQVSNEMCMNDFHCECTRWAAYYGICVSAGTPDPGLHGSQIVESGTTGGGLNYLRVGSFDPDCTDGMFNTPVKWQNEVYYTLTVFDVTLPPSPPGTEPLDLADMVQLISGDDTNSGELNNLTIGNLGGLGLPALQYPALGIDATPVPLSLLSFNASPEGEKSAKLNWTTANELNTKLFVVQRSTNSNDWTDIGAVEAAGFNSGILDYSFIDKNVYNGRSERQMFYYRLKMVDQDDQFEYSNIDVVSFNTFGENDNAFDLFVYPNPAKDGVNVEINQVDNDYPITRLELLDIAGRVVYSRDFDEGSLIEYVDFSRHNITSGTYILKASDAIGTLKAHEKIVVTR